MGGLSDKEPIKGLFSGVFGLLLAKLIAKVCVVPMAILAPIILGLAALGAYATNTAFMMSLSWLYLV